jgi:hypothetical protein
MTSTSPSYITLAHHVPMTVCLHFISSVYNPTSLRQDLVCNKRITIVSQHHELSLTFAYSGNTNWLQTEVQKIAPRVISKIN